MNELLKYKNYLGSVEVDLEDKVLHGKVLFINGLITYEAVNFDLDDLTSAFEAAIDEYLADCMELGITPEQTCEGQITVNISPKLHVDARLTALKNHESLNALIKRSLEAEIYGRAVNHNAGVFQGFSKG
ncbi:MAG: type II toxin-antitoxin system HicB family antitoxin [Methylovulum sp.]|nr:type II toxin-antitoxin system HicB family antitoxin [Methylovulum sp.]